MNIIENINEIVLNISNILWGWPLVITFIIAGAITTIALNFVQIRYFLASWQLVLFAKKEKTQGELTSIQAFINALGASTGNGSIAGIATAVYAGGPGAAFWILIAGFFSLAIRFAEVFLATSIKGINPLTKKMEGGPMVYLTKVPAGNILSYLFTIFMFLLGVIGGSAMQANSITLGAYRTWGFNKFIIATILFVFIIYVMVGGAQRIIKISDKLVPFKVAIFFISSLIVLFYHAAGIIPAFKLIISSALNPQAVGGAVAGFTIQQSIRNGFARILNANESGLGTAAVLFGATGSKNPMKDSVMSMLSTFISTYLVCFMVAFMIILTGVWNNGQTSTALTISAFETVFGNYGGWIVTFLSAAFGLGVLVPFAFITRETWIFLTNGRWVWAFSIIYCLATFFGGIVKVDLIWNSIDIVNGGLFLINMYAIIYLLPFIRKNIPASTTGSKILSE